MSDESATSPETSSTPPAETTKRVRRVSNPRPRKKPKVLDEAPTAADAVPPSASPKSSKFPEFSESSEPPVAPSSGSDWPEPETPTSDDSVSSENPKRKRRRKKGKSNGTQNAVPQAEGGSASPSGDEPVEALPPQPKVQPSRPNPQPRLKLDPELLTKCAWKIYLAEISEEGVALVGDNDAKELSRRCFRLAEIFLEEQVRHH